MALKHSYTLLAPLYDFFVAGPLNTARTNSIGRITDCADKNILIYGIGSGLDIPHLPHNARYTGSDITPAMLKIAQLRAQKHAFPIELICADSQQLPFDDGQFDIVLMHLILAVVPQPVLALQEAARVLKPGGSLYIFDKFLKPGELAPVRKAINLLSRHIATRMDVVFEETLAHSPSLKIISDEPVLANGWFRLIKLEKSLINNDEN
ncbi:MAG: class I SAM-dependent methyltransferase [Gammaproteobacteria bacterium]|jgi:phosphatidylethanolamine/phosphatidyl-N-methylethanolamine N-methyltransferase|nr:class I SAM-dependent methyltransferase [Gammaproteobacteria bacterium]